MSTPPPPQLGSRPKLGGAGGWKFLQKCVKKTKFLLKNEGKIVIQEKSFAKLGGAELGVEIFTKMCKKNKIFA